MTATTRIASAGQHAMAQQASLEALFAERRGEYEQAITLRLAAKRYREAADALDARVRGDAALLGGESC